MVGERLNDLVFLFDLEPEEWVIVWGGAATAAATGRTDPQLYFKVEPGVWWWEGNCAQFKSGYPRAPWLTGSEADELETIAKLAGPGFTKFDMYRDYLDGLVQASKK